MPGSAHRHPTVVPENSPKNVATVEVRVDTLKKLARMAEDALANGERFDAHHDGAFEAVNEAYRKLY